VVDEASWRSWRGFWEIGMDRLTLWGGFFLLSLSSLPLFPFPSSPLSSPSLPCLCPFSLSRARRWWESEGGGGRSQGKLAPLIKHVSPPIA
jgi:hypothetical protein